MGFWRVLLQELSFLDVIFKFLIPYLLFSVTLYFT